MKHEVHEALNISLWLFIDGLPFLIAWWFSMANCECHNQLVTKDVGGLGTDSHPHQSHRMIRATSMAKASSGTIDGNII